MIALEPDDPRYPPRLRDLRDPPAPLWVDGDVEALHARAVGIVGTRRLTPYGARVARELAGAVAAAGVVVISGLAQGVDSCAHEAALDADGATVAVLGGGIVACRRELNGRRRRLAHAIRARGALVSEFPPDAPPRRWTFAQRDATIAALGEITIVVEAPADSGALITATEAERLARPLFSVPGPIGVRASVGTNALIASGRARALTGATIVLEALGVEARDDAPRARDDITSAVLDALAAGPASPDVLARQLGRDVTTLATVLARLLLSGDVSAGADGRFARR